LFDRKIKNANINWPVFFFTLVVIILFISIYKISFPILPHIEPKTYNYNFPLDRYPHTNLSPELYEDNIYPKHIQKDDTEESESEDEDILQIQPNINPRYIQKSDTESESEDEDKDILQANLKKRKLSKTIAIFGEEESSDEEDYENDPRHINPNISYLITILTSFGIEYNTASLYALDRETSNDSFVGVLDLALLSLYEDNFDVAYVNSLLELNIFQSNSVLPLVVFNGQNLLETLQREWIKPDGNCLYAAVLKDYDPGYPTNTDAAIYKFKVEVISRMKDFNFDENMISKRDQAEEYKRLIQNYEYNTGSLSDMAVYFVSIRIGRPIVLFDATTIKIINGIVDADGIEHGGDLHPQSDPLFLYLNYEHYNFIVSNPEIIFVYSYMRAESLNYMTYEELYQHYYMDVGRYNASFIVFNSGNELYLYYKNSNNFWQQHYEGANELTDEELLDIDSTVKIVIYR